ncbi:hypothetical protein B0A48_11613 [Cryoendolithus antarcticus]|uniref:Uncharacterized protein n=1 Tax=Cryoendolithus antarcticus TaxID=1507870 RepID=A0A1V8SW00_9PEZI|nr:hypothetical protein B0A48_11613 [Cryoendolithus antarcticus]
MASMLFTDGHSLDDGNKQSSVGPALCAETPVGEAGEETFAGTKMPEPEKMSSDDAAGATYVGAEIVADAHPKTAHHEPATAPGRSPERGRYSPERSCVMATNATDHKGIMTAARWQKRGGGGGEAAEVTTSPASEGVVVAVWW